MYVRSVFNIIVTTVINSRKKKRLTGLVLHSLVSSDRPVKVCGVCIKWLYEYGMLVLIRVRMRV